MKPDRTAKPGSHRRQRGQAVIFAALAGAVLAAMAALAIDGGIAESDRRLLQSVNDGAALAGAQHLSSSPTSLDQQEARQAAVLYAVSTLANGNASPTLPAGCGGQATDFGSPGHAAGSAPCDPDSSHSLYVQTPYCPTGTCHPDQILVQINHSNPANLAQVVGVTNTSVAARAVAREFSGGSPFGYAMYVQEELTLNGNVPINVGGNVFVGGCITGTNYTSLTAYPTANGQAGKIEVYYGEMGGVLASTIRPKQIWDQGAGLGEHCKAQVYTAAQAGLPASFAAAGHLNNGSDWTCGQTAAPAHFPGASAACPTGEPPVSNPGLPGYGAVDPWNCDTATRATFPTGNGVTVRPGCYNSCAAGGGNVNIGSGDVFAAGTYSFFPSATGCNVEFTGDASSSVVGACSPTTEGTTNPLPSGQACGTDGTSAGGVTFYLYNGTGWCFAHICNSSLIGTLNLNAPNNPSYLNGQNSGMLVFDCPSGGIPCGPGGGQITIQGPSAALTLVGVIYAPTGTCTIQANGTQTVLGQVICQNASVQGGASSTGDQIGYGGPVLPTPRFLTELIE